MFTYQLLLDGNPVFTQSTCNFEIFRRRLDWLRIVASRMHNPSVLLPELTGKPCDRGVIYFDDVKDVTPKAA